MERLDWWNPPKQHLAEDPHPSEDEWLRWKATVKGRYKTAPGYRRSIPATKMMNERLQLETAAGSTEGIQAIVTEYIEETLKTVACPPRWHDELFSAAMCAALERRQNTAEYSLRDLYHCVHEAIYQYVHEELQWHERHETGNETTETSASHDAFDDIADAESAACVLQLVRDRMEHAEVFLRHHVDEDTFVAIAEDQCKHQNIQAIISRARSNFLGDAMRRELFRSGENPFASEAEQRRILETQAPLIDAEEHQWPTRKRRSADRLRNSTVENLQKLLSPKRGGAFSTRSDADLARISIGRMGSQALPLLNDKLRYDAELQHFGRIVDSALQLIEHLPEQERKKEPELPTNTNEALQRMQSLKQRVWNQKRTGEIHTTNPTELWPEEKKRLWEVLQKHPETFGVSRMPIERIAISQRMH